MGLGKLEKVENLRSVWEHEARDFTNWLAEEENLNTLGNEIGIDIVLLSTEAKTGSFSTDILAIEAYTDNKIIIENQLEKTDHDHLGKLITYASGHDAKIIIWIVKEALEEHRQAVDWLNEHTDEEINIFLCEIELWKIGNSQKAPKFQIISSPNNWTKTMKRSLNNIKTLQYEYWTKVKEEIDKNCTKFKSRKPDAEYFYVISIGSSLAHMGLLINTRNSEIRSEIFIRNNRPLFDYLYNLKDDIENELGFKLNWNISEKNNSVHIDIVKNIDISDRNNWDESIKWHLNTASKLYDSFSDRIKAFKF